MLALLPDSLTNTRQDQIRVINVARDRKMQKEAMSGPEGERKEPACFWSLANIQKQEDAKA